MDRDPSDIVVIPVINSDDPTELSIFLDKSLSDVFDARTCTCFKVDEKEKILQIIETAFGGYGGAKSPAPPNSSADSPPHPLCSPAPTHLQPPDAFNMQVQAMLHQAKNETKTKLRVPHSLDSTTIPDVPSLTEEEKPLSPQVSCIKPPPTEDQRFLAITPAPFNHRTEHD